MFSVFFALLLVSWWSEVFSGNVVNIERRVINTNGNWTHQADTFELPPSLCSGDGSAAAQCATLGGHYIGNCICECTRKRSTFGFYDNQWSCTANAKVRQYGECSLVLLRGKTVNSTLITIPEIVRAKVSYEISTNLQGCYIIPSNSRYLRCDGTWESLDDYYIFIRSFFVRANHLFLKETISSSPEMKGRVLRLPIGCYMPNAEIRTNCLLLKMQGPIACSNFSLPTSIKAPITAATKLPNTSGFETQPTDYPSTNKKYTEAGESTSVTSTTKMTPPNFDNKRKKGASEEEKESIGLISGAVAGVIGLALIIIAVVIILRRRNKRNDAVSKVVENVGYESGADNSIKIIKRNQQSEDQEYSYASVDSLPRNRRKMEVEHPNNQDPRISAGLFNHVYSEVEDLDQSAFPPRVGACAYNPSSTEYPSDTRIYNTIDESSYSQVQNPSKKVNPDEPIYNNHNRQNAGVYQAVDHADIKMGLDGFTAHSNA